MLTLTLYSRPDCCLCEEMKAVLTQVQRDIPFALEQIDISIDPELESRFGQEIPVLFVNGRKACKYRLTASELRRRLARESAAL
ncbi:MAG: glutaredoxin family protein [Deltaproteobacteria bacterium]|nr:glutaredoxin family protein [Deltaproteobacteria bacterium]